MVMGEVPTLVCIGDVYINGRMGCSEMPSDDGRGAHSGVYW